MSIRNFTVGIGLDVAPSGEAPAALGTAISVLPFDPQLPARDLMLDDATAARVFAERLGEQGRLDVRRVERLRAKYRIGESLRTVHRVWLDGTGYLVSMRMRATGAETMFAEARLTAHGCSPARGVWFDPNLQAVFWTFPNDRCLTGLDAFSSPPLFVRDLYPGDLAMDIVGYNPERAAIARLSLRNEPPVAFAKLYANDDLEASKRALLWLEQTIAVAGSRLRVPRLKACDHRRRLLVIEAVAGQHLETVPDTELPRAFRALGTSLAHLHALPTDVCALTLPEWNGFADDELARASDVVMWARPELGDLAQRTVALLQAHRCAEGGRVCVHGDMNARNWLFASGGGAAATQLSSRDDVGLIDFDLASRGPAAADIASVLALVRTRALTGAWTHCREAELASALRSGYEVVRPFPSHRELRWFQAAAMLVERAQRSISRVRPDQIAHLGSIVADAYAHAVEVSRG